MISLHYDSIRPIYYLKKWQYYERARYELSSNELENAKVFFHAMKQLDEDDRYILMDVYYHSKEPCAFDVRTGFYQSLYPVKDSILAKKYGVAVDRFGNMRRIAMMNLKKEMKKVLCMVSKKFVFRLSKKLYLVDILTNEINSHQYVMGNRDKAKLFIKTEKTNHFFIDMLILGFESVPIN